jgi:hypothetical protein
MAAAGLLPALGAGPVSVTVNGSPINLNPAPTERAGRVFVPLRGVFENLGATVVYENGLINASGRGHSVSLRIGSQQATVDGRQQTVDVAPFIIGASTYVPLRFVSQALGASVNYDGSNNLVAINTNGSQGSGPPSQTITPVASRNSALTLQSVIPARGGTVNARRPTIEASFGAQTADPNTIKVYVDRLDVTSNATRSPNGIAYAPPSPLMAGRHTVRVTGIDAAGAPFDRSWSFSSGSSTASTFISDVKPPSGSTVPSRFTVSGHTSPNASVVIQIGASQSASQSTTLGTIIGLVLGGNTGAGQGSSAQLELTADANGNFSRPINMNVPSGTNLTLVIHATDPQTGAAATPFRESLVVE